MKGRLYCVDKELDVEHRSHQDGRARDPDLPDCTGACTVARGVTNLKEFALMNFPERAMCIRTVACRSVGGAGKRGNT